MGGLLSLWRTRCDGDDEEDEMPLLLPVSRGNVRIIGLAGKAGAGKDTAADYLVTTRSYEKHAFADPLKNGVAALFGISMEHLNDPVMKEMIDPVWRKTPRHLLQWLGTDVLRRDISNQFFLVSMARTIEESKSDTIVISDVRFDDEALFIKQLGGHIFKIERPGYDNGMSSGSQAHASERGISPSLVDRVLKNSTTEGGLYLKLADALASITPPPLYRQSE